MKRNLLMAIVVVFALAGCASLLPSEKRTVKSPWKSFSDAKTAFDRIVPYQTTTDDLVKLEFDPYTTSNITILTYLDIIQRFMPNPSISQKDLDQGLQDCLSVKDLCGAYEMKQQNLQQERYGNVFLDIFNFRRQSRRSGWEFDVLIVMKNNMVVYKLWNGKPNVDETVDTRNPLGPLQDLGFWNRILVP
jgi:hypothetical protein